MGKKISIKKINKKEKRQSGVEKSEFKSAVFSVVKVKGTNIFRHAFSGFFWRFSVVTLSISFVFQGLYLNKLALAADLNVEENQEKQNTILNIDDSVNTDINLIEESHLSNSTSDFDIEASNDTKEEEGVEENQKEETLVIEDLAEIKEVEIPDEKETLTANSENFIEENSGDGKEVEESSSESVEKITDEDLNITNTVNIEISDHDYDDKKQETSSNSKVENSNDSNERGLEVEPDNDKILKSETEKFTSSVERTDGLNFSKDECVVVADGSFYCNKRLEKSVDNALFSAPDADGDLEIFLVKDGKQMQITHNLTDDASPFFDNISNTIVWHRLINDRYQIVSYNLKTSQETVMTSGSVNNMEPTRQGEYTVWQRWTGGNWNIVLSVNGEEANLTNDIESHNLTPRIQGSLVIWNHHSSSGEKKVGIYNLETKTLIIVDDPEGLTVDNPRVVLMYDSLHPDGEVVTKGFDLISNQFIDLSSLPKNLPDIPRSEEVKETKALTQTKLEQEAVVENGDLPKKTGGSGKNDNENDDGNISDTNINDENGETSLTSEQITTELENNSAKNIEETTGSNEIENSDFTLDLSNNQKNNSLDESFDLVVPKFSETEDSSV